MQSIDNVLKLRKGLKPDDPNPDIFDILWAKKLSGVAKDYTVTGNPISFLAKKAQTAKSTKITLEPVQDLHGYSNPWPAGGGKNKIPYPYYSADGTYSGIPFSTASDGKITASGTTNAAINYYLIDRSSLAAGTYTMSVKGIHSGMSLVARDRDNSVNLGIITSGSSDGYVTFTLSEDCSNFALYFNTGTTGASININAYVQLESGSTATSYAPYSNICPISGRSSVEIKGCGKNRIETVVDNVLYRNRVYSLTFDDGVITFTPNPGASTSFFLLKAFKITSDMVGKTYTYSFNSSPQLSSEYSAFVICDDNGDNRVAKSNGFTITDAYVGKNLTIRFYSVNSNQVYTISQIQVEEGDATAYEPYTESNDVTISFGETVYGGTLDIETGTVKVNKFRFVFDESSKINDILINVSSTDARFFRKTITNSAAVSPTLTSRGCSHYPNATVNSQTTDTGYYAYTSTQNPTSIYIQFRDNDKYVTATQCKQWFTDQLNNGTPVEVWYTVTDDYATTLTLTPSQIQILKGQNTIWIEDEEATIALTYKN